MMGRHLAVLSLLALVGCSLEPAPKCDGSGTLNLRIVGQDYHVKTSELISIDYWNQQRPEGILDKNGYRQPKYCRDHRYGKSPVEVRAIGLEVPLADGSNMLLEIGARHRDQPGWRPFRSADIKRVRMRSVRPAKSTEDVRAVFELRDGSVSEATGWCFKPRIGNDLSHASCRIFIPLETGNSLTAYSNIAHNRPPDARTDDLIRALAWVEKLEADSEKAFAAGEWP